MHLQNTFLPNLGFRIFVFQCRSLSSHWVSGGPLRDIFCDAEVFLLSAFQVLPKEDVETLNLCRSMMERGEWPPLMVVFDPREGYVNLHSPIFVFFLLIGTQPNLFIHGHRFTVEADRFIKDLTIITEYTGDVDYLKNREHDDGDSMMTLLSATNPSKSLVICPDKRSNIARFINGINNHTP